MTSMTSMPELTTARLTIRPFHEADFDACVMLHGIPRADERALEALRRQLAWSVLNHEVLAELIQPPYGDRAVKLRASGELVGSVGLVPSLGPFGQLPEFGADRDNPAPCRFTPEVGLYWATSPASRNQGFATEAAAALIDYAFSRLNLARIVATTERANAASAAVMRKLGMTIAHNPLPEPPWFQVVGVLLAPER